MEVVVSGNNVHQDRDEGPTGRCCNTRLEQTEPDDTDDKPTGIAAKATMKRGFKAGYDTGYAAEKKRQKLAKGALRVHVSHTALSHD
mmetsp:Transcript_51236/g.120084  ORF Transcript_51236/g.120084 Transcript_51236/m.120084 type:complete len:87 (-) Transcript_51236:53-313(-)